MKKKIDFTVCNDILRLTKAEVLNYLKNRVTKSKIEDLLIISANDFINNSTIVLNDVIKYFFPSDIIVRSSSKFEDSFYESNAGHYESILNVKTSNRDEVKKSIKQVINSYGEYCNDEQVLIQSQTKDVVVSGVVFTRDIKKNRPYYIINYEQSGNTNYVTSGLDCNSLFISCFINNKKIPNRWRKLVEAIKEIESIFSNTALDIEFAITNESIVIFQVRPLSSIYKNGLNKKIGLDKKMIGQVIKKYRSMFYNKLTCFSDMAFWNPVEIIGDNPFPLDYSLYAKLITDSSWNSGLISLGYRKVPHKLMYCFGNKPYINLEYSFESLIPADISDQMSKKLIDFYITKFKSDLSAHDKIEFEISHNCFDFSLHNRIQELKKYNFTENEISKLENSLIKLTTNVINNYTSILEMDLNDIHKLERIREDIQFKLNKCSDVKKIANCIKKLVYLVRKLGTTQFSRQARCAFMAKSLINSLLNENYISYEEYNNFMSSIHTIASEFDNDCNSLVEGDFSFKQFKLKYGHLRPGTYDIRSKRYDQISKSVLISDYASNNEPILKDINNVDKIINDVLDSKLKLFKINNIETDDVVSFIKQSIEEREYFKFTFTKSVSFIIELIKRIGKILNITNDNLSYLTISDIIRIDSYDTNINVRDILADNILNNKNHHSIFSNLMLPEIICSELDIECFESIDTRPNFITESIISGELIFLKSIYDKVDVRGKIVVVERADPGYDWIFLKGMVGIITKHGGISSHLSIRCHEFNIPAAIGCGQKIFEKVCTKHVITIDCKNKKIY